MGSGSIIVRGVKAVVDAERKKEFALGEMVIEDVVDGDWRAATLMAEHLSFAKERPEVQAAYGPLWARFREIVETEALLARKREADPMGCQKKD
jgi:hypothetical protein